MDDLERVELLSVLDLFAAAPSELAAELDLALLEVGGATAFSVGAEPKPLIFNRVVGLADEGALPELVHWAASRGCPLAVPLRQGSGLEEPVRRHGFQAGRAYMRFRRGVEPPSEPTTSLRVEPVDRRRAAEYGNLVAAIFGAPEQGPLARWFAALPGREGWICMGALDEDRLVGSAVAYLAGDHAWLGAAGTLPEARGRGAQTTLLAARIGAVLAAGASVLTTETDDQVGGTAGTSFRNVVRAGFAEAFRQQWWELPRA
jgi:hypothetical protein